MLSDGNGLLPFMTLITVALILLSAKKKWYSVIVLGLLISYLGLDTLLEWNNLKTFSHTLLSHSEKSLGVLVTFAALLLFTSQKRLLDLTIRFLIILPLLFWISLSSNIFYLTMSASLLLAVAYYQVSKNLSLSLLKSVMRSASIEMFLVIFSGLMGLLTVSMGKLGHHFIFPYIVSVLLSYLYILLQGPINVRLFQDGMTTDKILTLAIPKTILFIQLILTNHEIFNGLEKSYQDGLLDFILYFSTAILGILSFMSLIYKGRANYSKLYILSQFTGIACLVTLGVPSGNLLLLTILFLDTLISFCALVALKKRSLTGFLFGLQTSLLPIGVVFFSKIILIRFVILESGYHVFSYFVLVNQVCLSVAAFKLISLEDLGKINLSARHAVYLSYVIISACLMVTLP